MGADTLENLNERYEQDNGKDHDEIFVAVVAVAYGYLAESAAADYSAHCGVAEDGSYRYREVREQRGNALGNHDFDNYLHGRSSHALRGFNYIRVDLAQAAFNKARHKRERRDDERDYRGDCADRRADNKAGQRDLTISNAFKMLSEYSSRLNAVRINASDVLTYAAPSSL